MEGSKLVFSDGSTAIETQLQELKLLGTVRAPSGEPFYLVTGRSCKTDNCAMNVYAFARPEQKMKPVTFVYPGTVIDTRKGGVVFKGRAFFGRCLPSGEMKNQDYYVVFQDERIDRKHRLQSSVFVARPDTPYWVEKLLSSRKQRMPRLKDTLHLVKTRVCHEIEGRTRNALRRPFQVKLPPGLEEDDDDTENKPAAPAAH